MDKLKGLTSGGWHPGKNDAGGGGVRNKVKGLIGKGEDEIKYTSYSTPYEKKDPSKFPPPPKTKTYAPGERPVIPARSSQFTATSSNSPATRDSNYEEQQPPPPSYSAIATPPTIKPKPPSLPPRTLPSDPNGSQLGAGVTGKAIPPQLPARSDEPTAFAQKPAISQQVNELQARFAKFSTNAAANAPANSATSTGPTQGTSWKEKTAALNTANKLRDDPSNVSLSEIQTTASTAKNFHDRHGERVANGMQTANQLNQRYGGIVGNKVAPPVPTGKKPPIPLGTKPRT